MDSQIFRIDNETSSKIYKVLGKSEQEVERDVDILKKWFVAQPHFPENPDGNLLKNFLIFNKFSIEITKEKIDAYYTVRSQVEEIYEAINPELPHMQELMDAFYMVASPKRSKDLYTMGFGKLRSKEFVPKLEPINALRQLLNFQEIRIRNELCLGEIFIIDVQDLSPAVMKITPTLLYKALIIIYQRVFSFRLKGVYLINSPPILEKILAIVKTLIKPKMFERFHICTLDKVREDFSPDLLPEDFGGDLPPLEQLQELTRKRLKEEKDLFDRLDKLRINEKLRPEKLQNDDLLGFHGNFKRLDID